MERIFFKETNIRNKSEGEKKICYTNHNLQGVNSPKYWYNEATKILSSMIEHELGCVRDSSGKPFLQRRQGYNQQHI